MYVVDTHAWVFYLLNRLPKKISAVFSDVEGGKETLFVPSIALMECVHLVEKGKIELDYETLFSGFEKGASFEVAELDLGIVKMLPSVRLREIHDRVMVATAKQLNATLITKDREIRNAGLVKTLWN